jgi:hypothetical protein
LSSRIEAKVLGSSLGQGIGQPPMKGDAVARPRVVCGSEGCGVCPRPHYLSTAAARGTGRMPAALAIWPARTESSSATISGWLVSHVES